MDGFGFGALYHAIITMSGVLGIVLLITAFVVRLKRRRGKILLAIGILCLLPYGLHVLNNLHHRRTRWTDMGSLYQAIDKNSYDHVEELLKHGADVNEVNTAAYPATPLTYAISKSDIRIVRLLVENGANVNLDTTNTMLPLNEAIFRGDTAMLACLLEHGADVSKEANNPPEHPIQYAARISAGKDVFGVLLKYGADINAASGDGYTPLQLSILEKNAGAVRYLLESGADISNKGARDKSPLEIAETIGNTEIVELLKQYGAKKE